MSAAMPPDVDAAMVLGMASTALPFASSAEDEAERWLRILRLHGDAGAALQALGVSEAPLEAAPEHDAQAGHSAGQMAGHDTRARTAGERGDMIAAVTSGAVRVAASRSSQTVGAGDVLVAVIGVYGEDFERVLRVHGTDRDEVLARLGIAMPDGIAV